MIKFPCYIAKCIGHWPISPPPTRRAIPQWVFALLIGISTLSPNLWAQPTVVKHYAKGFSPALSEYLTQVLVLCLEQSEEEFGPFTLEVYPRELSSNRSKLETERGVALDVLFATNWLTQRPEPLRAVALEFPVFFGTLGLRSLIIEEQASLTAKDMQQFLSMRAGQGADWIDVSILRANGIEVVEAQHFGALFPMLERRRFDYLPLSVLEANQTLSARQTKFPTLRMETSLKLYYPIPTYLYVNAERTNLIERLTLGLRKVEESGALAELFETHFHHIDTALRTDPHQVILLNNPFISPEHNQQIAQGFLSNYSDTMEVLTPLDPAATP